MMRVVLSAFVVLALALGLRAQTAPAAPELTRLLKEFLSGASRNDAAAHDRFWAEDLIYTGSSGRRVGKADIMRGVRSAQAPKPGGPTTTYSAEDIRIRQYGDVAVVAFRLVSTTEKDGRTTVANFLNTGTFLKREGRWQAVSWQATALPRTEGEATQGVAAAEAAFRQAVLASDVKTLESLTDESFVWTQPTGERQTRRQLLDGLASGRLRYSRQEAKDVTVNVYGDAAVVRGSLLWQRPSPAGAESVGDAGSSAEFYTLTLVNKGGEWKAVAMHSSRP
jgi:ketosteroid isomerase-like protein